MKTASKKLLKVPYYILIVCMAAVGLLLLGTLIPIPGNIKVKIVKSGSMEPAIQTGGIVVIKPATVYNVGDVITFGADTKTQIPTTHRIVEVKGEGKTQTFVTKGDANDEIDPKETTQSEIAGKIVFSAPYLGYILDFARQPLGFLLIVGIPAGFVIFDEVAKIWREVKKMKHRKRRKNGKMLPVNHISDFSDDRDLDSSNVLDLRITKLAEFATKQKNKHQSSGGVHTSNVHFRALVIILLMIGGAIGITKIGTTISYYNENETSVGNKLQASSDYGNNQIEIDVTNSLAKFIQEEPVIETELPETELVETEITETEIPETELIENAPIPIETEEAIVILLPIEDSPILETI